MVLAALLLICAIPQVDDAAKVVNDSPAVVADSAAKDASAPAALPSAPAPKIKAVPEAVCKFKCDLCGNAGEPCVHGFSRQANDGEPEPLGTTVVVGAAGGGRGLLVCRGRAQHRRRALKVSPQSPL